MRRGFEAFAHRDFVYFWFYRVFAWGAIEMLITTVGWQVYRVTGSALDLGLVGLAQFAPYAVLFPLTGLAADRFPRGRILAFCGTLQTGAVVALALLGMSGNTAFAPIMGVLVLFGIARAFQQPAQQAMVAVIVPKADFGNAVAWSNTGSKIARVVGPALGGLLIAVGTAMGHDEVLVYWTLSVTFGGCLFLALMIRARGQVMTSDRVTLDTLMVGLRFIWTRNVILSSVILDLFAVLFGGAMALLPVYAADILQVGPEGNGLLRAGYMCGAFAGGLALTRWPVRSHAGVTLLLTVATFGAGVIVFGVSTLFWLSFAALAVMGCADMVSVFVRHNLIQLVTPDDMRGRVGAATGVFIGASNELGEFESGVTAHWWGVVPAVVVGGAATISVAALVAWLSPALRKVDSLDADALVDAYQAPHDRHGNPI